MYEDYLSAIDAAILMQYEMEATKYPNKLMIAKGVAQSSSSDDIVDIDAIHIVFLALLEAVTITTLNSLESQTSMRK